MKIDIVIPQKNESELLAIAEKLGFKQLIFLYEDLNAKFPKVKSNKVKVLSAGLIVDAKHVDKALKKFDLVFGPAQRNFFENRKIKYLINAETSSKDDFLYQRRAGLDDVMCRLAKEKNKVIVFNIQFLSYNNILARMMQNAKLCRKYKVKTLIASFATNPYDMRAPKDIDGFARALKIL